MSIDTPTPPQPSVDTMVDLGRRHRLVRFVLVGGVGFVVNTAVVALLLEAGLVSLLASTLATETAILVNYVGHETFTFGTRRLRWRRLLGYNASAMLGLVITAVAFALLEGWVDWPLVVVNLAAVACGTGSNFLVSSRFVWRDGTGESGATP